MIAGAPGPQSQSHIVAGEAVGAGPGQRIQVFENARLSISDVEAPIGAGVRRDVAEGAAGAMKNGYRAGPQAHAEKGDVAAGTLLLELAESTEWAKNPAAREQILSLAEQWAKEPQVVLLDTGPQLAGGMPQLALTDGTAVRREEEPGIVDADFEMAPEGP